ncbi:MAG: hypothetical protein ACI83W_001203 [Marinoscillum sp.]|jgi:hypothetical protein
MGLSIQPLLAQEDIIKNIVQDNVEYKFAFYASTLRMINLKENKEYDEMVSGIDKLLVYTLDSTGVADKTYLQIGTSYRERGYDEYMMSSGSLLNMAILGNPKNDEEFVGYISQEESCFAFYLRGDIAWEKIPKLINTMRDLDLLNIMDLEPKKNRP